MGKKVLVTGASGFIGSFIVEKALNLGYETYVAVRKSSNKQFLKDERINFIEIDFINKELLKKIVTNYKFDFIIHAAGLTKAQKIEEFDIVNYHATKNLVDSLIETDNIPIKFVFISSMAAHGPGNDNDTEPVKPIDEPHPDTAYGVSKLKAENYINSLKSSFPYITLRPTGVYGPREKDYFVFFKTLNSGIEPYIGLKKQYLTFIYVKDLVNVVFKAMVSEITGKTYFVSDGKSYTAEEFANITKIVLNKKTVKLYVPLVIVKFISYISETVNGWFGKVSTLNKDKYNVLKARNWLCDTSELVNDFDFKPDYYLEDGVKEAISWYKENKWLK